MTIHPYDKDYYVDKYARIWLDNNSKIYGIILNVDSLGWVVRITRTEKNYRYPKGAEIFISHTSAAELMFVDESVAKFEA